MLKFLIREGISIVVAPRPLSQLRRGGRQWRNVNSVLSFPPEKKSNCVRSGEHGGHVNIPRTHTRAHTHTHTHTHSHLEGHSPTHSQTHSVIHAFIRTIAIHLLTPITNCLTHGFTHICVATNPRFLGFSLAVPC